MIVAGLDAQSVAYIQAASPESVHHGFGMHMRNGYSFWETETPIKRDAVETYGIAHAADMSGLIMEWVWHQVRGEEFDPIKHVETYHKHWKSYNTTSLQAGGYNEDGTPNETR